MMSRKLVLPAPLRSRPVIIEYPPSATISHVEPLRVHESTPDETTPDEKEPRRIGEHLLDLGMVDASGMDIALAEQRKTGGRLGEILLSSGFVDSASLSLALANQHDLPSFVPEYEATAALPRTTAHRERAAVLVGPIRRDGKATTLVAVTDLGSVPKLSASLGGTVAPRLTDPQTMDGLLAEAYADADVSATRTVLSAKRTRTLRRAAAAAVVVVPLLVAATAAVGTAVLLGVAALASLYSLLSAAMATSHSRRQQAVPKLSAVPDVSHGQTHPEHSLLLILSRETAGSLRGLRDDLDLLDFPRHRLQAIAVYDAADRATRRALSACALPPWVTVLAAPHNLPRGHRSLALYALRQARGDFVTASRTTTALKTEALYEPAGGRGSVGDRFLRQVDHWPLRPQPGRFHRTELLSAFGWTSETDDSPEAVAA